MLDRPDNTQTRVDTRIISSVHLSNDVLRLQLERPADYDYLPGQFLNLYNDQGVSRSYSLANMPVVDDFLECHIREISGGQVSGWAG